ncbi:MAG TPA: AAA family ATPase [Aquella sp.]|nr:AAA family ATPase [Aquella sp.]
MDEYSSLVNLLTFEFKAWVNSYNLENLIEIIVDYNRPLELRFTDRIIRSTLLVTYADIDYILQSSNLSQFSSDNRAGLKNTLHRISVLRNKNNRIIGLTMRIGRNITSTVPLIADLLDDNKSILFIGKPGTGKTSFVRQAACYLSDFSEKRVIIVDTSCEIAGDNDYPHESVGSARRLMVKDREHQEQYLLEAVQNHYPEYIIVDEISTRKEADSICSIAERGVKVIGTVHGSDFIGVLNNYKINSILGSVEKVVITDENAKKNDGVKIKTERRSIPPFEIVVELLAFDKIKIYYNTQETIDTYLTEKSISYELRTLKDGEMYCKFISGEVLS